MSECISNPCQIVKEGEQLDIKVPKSSIEIKTSVIFKEDGVYEVVVSNNQTFITVNKIGTHH